MRIEDKDFPILSSYPRLMISGKRFFLSFSDSVKLLSQKHLKQVTEIEAF